jgi:hypothetical protein
MIANYSRTNIVYYVDRFEVLTAVEKSSGLKMESECFYPSASPRGITAQETTIHKVK